LLVFILIGGVTTHIVNHDSRRDSISAPIHLVLAFVVGLAYWLADWREPFARSDRAPAGVRSTS
jgi:hypothetical protein